MISKILKGIAQNKRLASAYLFVGPPGVGKRQAATDFATLLDVKKQDKLIIMPKGASLKIEQIRELQGLVKYGPSISAYLVVIVEQADSLTDQAQAAFLKTLEEPAPGVVFILLIEREDKLVKTIVSRCQKLLFAENVVEPESNKEYSNYYQHLEELGSKTSLELLHFSSQLEAEKSRLDDLLYNLAYFAKNKLANVSLSRIILDTLRYIKRRANLKLALDVMCLKLGELSKCLSIKN